MILQINWEAPIPAPTCGFRVKYRQKSANSYQTVLSTGTSLNVYDPLGCYEGYVQGNCCASEYSVTKPFGINAYTQVFVTISKYAVGPNNYYRAHIQSINPIPYNTYITGSFIETCTGSITIPFTFNYLAGQTNQYTLVEDVNNNYVIASCGSPVVSGTTVDTIAVDFNNPANGELQCSDPVNTPTFMQPFWGTPPVWDGNPASLPSFTLDTYTGNVNTGSLTVSWIMSELFMSANSPYDSITLTVYDGNDEVGSTVISTDTLGLRTTSISLTKQTQNLVYTSIFTLVATLPNLGNVQIGTTYTINLPQ